MEEPDPSPLKNVTGGGGCGCGCLGMLLAMLASVALMAIPLEVFDESFVSTVTWSGITGLTVGGFGALLGGAVYIGSLFLD